MRTFKSEADRLREVDPTVTAMVETARALAEVSSVLADLSARVDRIERAVALLACDESLAGDTRLDVGIVLMGGEPT